MHAPTSFYVAITHIHTPKIIDEFHMHESLATIIHICKQPEKRKISSTRSFVFSWYTKY